MKFMYSAGDQPLAGYTIKRAIHRGGFGEVYYARTDAGRDVALKLLHDHREIELRGVTQCMNLKHPQLVTIFDIKTDADGDHWIVMEYMAGQTLAERLQQFPQGMPPEQVFSIFQQLAQGLEYLHSRSLAHRDLKPANIFLEAEGVKIGDVGLSKFIGPSQRSAQTQSVGTVHYMAPEVAKGRYGQGVDLYALGIIVFEMLTGRVPFEGESTAEILLKHLTQAPDLSSIEPRFRELLRKALEKEEEQRFRSIQEFEAAFARIMVPAQQHSPQESVAADPPADKPPHPQKHTCDWGCGTPWQAARRTASCTSKSNKSCQFLPADGSWWWLAASLFLLVMTLYHMPRTAGGFRFFSLAVVGVAAFYCYRRLNAPPRGSVPVVPLDLSRTSQQTPRTESPPLHRETGTRTQHLPNRKPPLPFLRTAREQYIALLQSLAVVPLLLLLIAGTILLFSRDFFTSDWHPAGLDIAHFGFFVASATLISWSLLAVNQWFRRLQPDYTFKKLLLIGAGALAGCGVYGINEWLLVQFPAHQFPAQTHGIISRVGRFELAGTKTGGLAEHKLLNETAFNAPHPERVSDDSAGFQGTLQQRVALKPAGWELPENPPALVRSWNPTAAGYAVFFGLLFALRSWEKLMDYRRQSRMSWFSIAATSGLAYLICCLFTFPAVWGITWAAAVTAAVQLASPCVQNR